MITSTNELHKLVVRAKKTDAIALDTEFFWERTYYPQLGCIQLALSNDECYLIDPTAISDLSPLGELLADRSVVKIFHDAPQDLAILCRATGVAPQNIFDTRLAAGFSSLSSTLSLGNLVKTLLDIDIPKTETRTDWLQRPLSEDQVEYAKDDVRYLQALRILLLSRIIGPKIKSWLQEELNLLNNPQIYLGQNTTDRYLKLRGVSSLNRKSLAVLRDLADWREETARTHNRPRGHIIQDQILVEIARKQPQTMEELAGKSEISAKAIERYGNEIVSIIQKTLSNAGDTYPELHRPVRLSGKDQDSLDRLQKLIALKCELLGIDPPLLGNASELKTIVKILNGSRSIYPQQLRQTEGWRKSFLEDFFHQNR
jgi:ribonuclease D